MAAAIPLANTVFPAPSAPDSTTTSPARSCSPSLAPSATVSSTRSSVAVPALVIAPQPFPKSAVPPDQPARLGPVHQPDQAIVDGVGLVQQRQVTGTGDDDQFRSR